jgi:hypothetical protein
MQAIKGTKKVNPAADATAKGLVGLVAARTDIAIDEVCTQQLLDENAKSDQPKDIARIATLVYC